MAKTTRSVKCTHCNKSFKNKQGLGVHLAAKHGQRSEPAKSNGQVPMVITHCPCCGTNIRDINRTVHLLQKAER